MRLVLTPIYNINLENWDIDCINKVIKTYNKVSKDISLWL